MKQILALIRQFSNHLCHLLMMVFTAEIYPTAIRTMNMGTYTAVGRKGAYLFLILLSQGQDQWGTLLIFGIMTLVGGFIVLGLSGTLNRGLYNYTCENKFAQGVRNCSLSNKPMCVWVAAMTNWAQNKVNTIFQCKCQLLSCGTLRLMLNTLPTCA